MREVQHHNIIHKVYEGELDFRQDYPDTPIKTSFRETQPLDWMWSSNGFIVQCLNIKQLVNKKNRHGNPLRNPTTTTMFYFPRIKASVREKDMDKRPLYFPTTNKNIINDNADYNLIHKPKIRLFAEYIKHGLSPQQAYTQVFGQTNSRRLSFLMARKDIINYIMQGNKAFMKEELEQAGLNKEELAKAIVKIVGNEKENAVVRKWALEFASKILDNESTTTASNEENSLLEASRLIHSNN